MRKPSSEQQIFRISKWAHGWGDPALYKAARGISYLRITPNLLTILGFFLCGCTAYFISQGEMILGGLILLPAGLCDVLDGPLANVTQKKTDLGAFLDSVLDQYSDVLIGFGVLWYYMNQNNELGMVLSFACVSGGLLVSYVRAKGSTLDVKNELGPLGRFERTLIMIVGFSINQPIAVLLVVAILSHYTALRRFFFTTNILNNRS